ncbi:MAG: HIT family protein [Simkaniaceae bacterium]|nr:HIT family protein [Simkaniaceae bacterium]
MTPVDKGSDCNISLPESGLTEDAVYLDSKSSEITELYLDELYDELQKIVHLWKEKNIAKSYLVLGTEKWGKAAVQAVPFKEAKSLVYRSFQQLQVLYRFVFGGYLPTQDRAARFRHIYRDLTLEKTNIEASKISRVSKCVFCESRVLDSQRVLEGKQVEVLYNYAPLGLGGERIHFLIVPKRHCKGFSELTKEEHREAYLIANYVSEKLKCYYEKEGSKIQNVYTYHKSGLDAGQSVFHFHLHLVMTQNRADELFGKLAVARNILFGLFPLSKEELEEKRRKYASILATKSIS